MQYRVYKPPALHQSVLARPEAVTKLNEAVSHPISLLWAPAGYGKSTLLSLFLQDYQYDRIWYPLTSRDNDDTSFCSLLLTGLIESNPRDKELEQTLKSIGQLNPKQQLDLFCYHVDRIYGQNDKLLILVLDDFHLIQDQSCLEVLLFISERLPINCRIIVSTREKPSLDIEKMQVSGELSVLANQDLLFSCNETQKYLANHCGSEISEELSSELYMKTSGWPVALQLLAVNENIQETQNSVKDLSVSERLRDYFEEQIVAKLSSEENQLLMRMAAFKDFSVELGMLFSDDAKTYIETYLSKRLIQRISKAGETWYKLHDLIREYLSARETLSASELEKAAAWFRNKGDREGALELYLQGENYSAALPLIVELCEDHMLYGNHRQFQKLIKRIPHIYLEENACALAFYAWHLDDHDKESVGMPLLDKAEAQIQLKLDSLGDGSEKERLVQVLIYVYCFRSFIFRFNNRIDQAVVWLEKAYQLAQGRVVKGLARIYAGKMQVAFALGSMTAAESFGKQSIAHARSEMDLTTLSISVGFLVNVFCAQGRLNEALIYSKEIKDWAEKHGVARFPMIQAIDSSLMEVNREMNRIADCYRGVEIGEAYGKGGAQESHRIAFEFAKIRFLMSIGKFDELAESFNFLEAMMPEAVGQAQNLNFSFPSVEIHKLAASFLTGGNIDLDVLTSKGKSLLGNELFVVEKEKLLVARLLAANDEFDLSLQLSAEAIKVAGINDRLQNIIYGELNDVLIHWKRGDKTLVRMQLEETLKKGLAKGFLRPFMELKLWSEPLYNWAKGQTNLTPYFAHFDASEPTPADSVVRPIKSAIEILSNRENTVLRLVSEGKSNKEIARELHISVNTVKTFTGHIFRKLEVRNRTEASVWYRESSRGS